MSAHVRRCYCCNRELPTATQFNLDPDHPGLRSEICIHCEILPAREASRLTRKTVALEQSIYRSRGRANREQRIAAKIVHYEAHGKRCTSCHMEKPPTAYNACASRSDGLQPMCRDCAKMRVALMKQQGGLMLWRSTRQALRDHAKKMQGK